MFEGLALGPLNLKIVLILTVGFTFASLLGYISHRIRVSPLLGYLLAGYLIGPFSPGFVADLQISEQLAEIGIILMMFGVGIHLKAQDLISVKNVAIPGAIAQTALTTVFATIFLSFLGWTLASGLVVGLAIGVASTVVLMRLLSENGLLKTRQGHISVGWLVLEDLIIVLVLLLLPVLSAAEDHNGGSFAQILGAMGIAVAKFAFLVAFMFTLGRKAVKWILARILETQSVELLTLTVLALIFLIATGSTLIFGTSIALGALIAGMIIGQSELKHQAAASAVPMKDAFVVIFFLSVGMLFDPSAIVNNFAVFVGVLALILIIKPLIAYTIIRVFKYSNEIAVVVAIALAQVGEFSFILAEEAMKLKILPDNGYDIIVAGAFISISLNPILFKLFAKRAAPR